MDQVAITIPTSQHQVLQGLILSNSSFVGKRPTILVLHGWMSSMRRFPERVAPLIAMGYVCLLFDMRGHGKTGYDLAPFSRKDHLEDCIVAYDYLSSRDNVDPDHISVMGSSYGGYQAVLLTQQRKVENLVLLAPANYQNEFFADSQLDKNEEVLKEYRQHHHTDQDNHTLKIASEFEGNVLLIQPELDQQVPAQVFKDYHSAFSSVKSIQHTIIREADHSFYNGNTNSEMIEKVRKWCEKVSVLE